MDQRQRVAMQRALVREALGKLHAAEELFGIEDGAVAGENVDCDEFIDRVHEFEEWLFSSSAIA